MAHKDKLLAECKEKLIEAKSDLLNRLVEIKRNFILNSEDKGGDEADQTQRILMEKQNLSNHQRLIQMLVDIEHALRKIETGSFGICEETEEPIEEARLISLPWTRLSIEGAELREAKQNIFRNHV